jgi:hypothetical protein
MGTNLRIKVFLTTDSIAERGIPFLYTSAIIQAKLGKQKTS